MSTPEFQAEYDAYMADMAHYTERMEWEEAQQAARPEETGPCEGCDGSGSILVERSLDGDLYDPCPVCGEG